MAVTEQERMFRDMLAEGIYVERRLTEVIPELADEAIDEKLRDMLLHHLDETQQQLENLMSIAEDMGFGHELPDVRSSALEGLVNDHKQAMERCNGDGAAIGDALIITGAMKNEHMEVAFYEGMITLANQLQYPEAADVLRQNLEQEQHTAKELLDMERRLMPA